MHKSNFGQEAHKLVDEEKKATAKYDAVRKETYMMRKEAFNEWQRTRQNIQEAMLSLVFRAARVND